LEEFLIFDFRFSVESRNGGGIYTRNERVLQSPVKSQKSKIKNPFEPFLAFGIPLVVNAGGG
jgi:hypothetical protein